MSRASGTIVLAVWVLLAAGCGAHPDVATSAGDAAAVAAGQDAPAVSAPDPPIASVPTGTSDEVGTAPVQAPAQGDDQPGTADTDQDPDPATGDDRGDDGDTGADDTRQAVPIDLTVTPSCVAVGQTVAAHIATVPDAELTLAVGYADGKPHGQMGFARADDAGEHVWRWVIGPDVPPGEATVLVMSVTPEGDAADTERAPFTVAPSGGCP